jgi:hypothetical protein
MDPVFDGPEETSTEWHAVLLACFVCGDEAVHVFKCGGPHVCKKCGNGSEFFYLEAIGPEDATVADID